MLEVTDRRGYREQVLQMFVVTEEIDDDPLETSPEEWHDSPSCIFSAHVALSIKTFGNFFYHDVAMKEDCHLTRQKKGETQ